MKQTKSRFFCLVGAESNSPATTQGNVQESVPKVKAISAG